MKTKQIFQKQFTEDVINASQDTIFVFNPETGKAIIWNKAFSEVSGYSDNEIKSLKAPDSYYSEEDLRKAELASKEVLKSGKTTLEMKLITKDGQKIPYEYSGTILQDPDGNILIVSIGRNISERLENEKKLLESERKYRSLFENMNAGFAYHEVIVNDQNIPIDYKYIEVNPKFEELTGLKKEHLIGKKVTEAIPGTENDPADWIGRFGNVGLTGIPLIVEDYSEAIEKWFKVSGYSPNKGYFAVTFTDITDIKIAEQKLRESEARYRIIAENTNTVVWSTDMNLNLTYVSSNSPNILGFTAEEAKSIPMLERMTHESLKKMSKIFSEELKFERKKDKDLNRSRTLELEQIHKNGYIVPVEITFTFLRDENDKAVGIIGTSQNISERKKAEQMLKDSEEKFRSLVETTSDWIWEVDIDGKYTYSNPKVKEILGYEVSEIIGKKPFDLMPTEEAIRVGQMFNEIKDQQKPIEHKKNKNIHKNGKIKTIETSGVPIFNENGSLIGYRGIDRDITEKVEAEQKLKESEEKYRSLTEGLSQTGIGIDIIDIYHNVVYQNQYLKDQFGEPQNKKCFEYFLEREEPCEDCPMIKAIHDKKVVKGTITSYNNRIYEIISAPLFNQIGQIEQAAEVIIDITERVESEKKLKESEQQLQERVKELNFLFGLSKIAEMQKLTPKEFIERIVRIIPSAMQFPELTMVRIIFDHIESKSTNFKITDWKLSTQIEINENLLEIEIYYSEDNPFLPEEANLLNELGKRVKNVLEKMESEQKRMNAQIELTKSYERLKELDYIINSSPGIVFLWQNSEGWPVEFVSENVKQFGYTQDDFYSGKVIYNQIIHPDDIERVTEEVNTHSNKDGTQFEQEYRIITKDGKVKWLDDRTWIRRDSEGNITHYQGIVLDITDRKRAEDALKKSERDYKEAYEVANFYKDLFTHDMNNILQIINSSAELISYQLVDSEKSKYIGTMTDMIKSQIERGSKLISNVRTLSELEEEHIIPNQIEINEYLDGAISFIKNAYSERQINILKDKIEAPILTNANELLEDVFENILINAVKYNENQDVEIIIKTSKQKINSKSYIKIEFIDNGIGVAEHRKKIIFQRGHREQKGSKGMGLGLSLVSKILNIFNGKVWVEDRFKGDYTKGSNFIILLPLID